MTNTKNLAGFLIVLQPQSLQGKIPLYYGSNMIGRSDAKATLVLKEVSVSQKHATLFVTQSSVTLTDIGSKNGTKLNKDDNLIEKNKEVTIDQSMIIFFADVKCKIELNPPKETEKTQVTKRKSSRKKLPTQSIDPEVRTDYSSSMMIPSRQRFVNRRIMYSDFYHELKTKFFLVIKDIEETFDYVVMRQYKRTFKALYAICKGIPIVDFNWISMSQTYRQIQKPEFYLFTKEHPQIYEAIQTAKSGQKVFQRCLFCLASKEYHFEIQKIKILIEAGGGSTINKIPQKLNKDISYVAIVANKKQEKQKQFESDIRSAKKQGFDKVYTIEMIMDSCQKQSIKWQNNDVSKL